MVIEKEEEIEKIKQKSKLTFAHTIYRMYINVLLKIKIKNSIVFTEINQNDIFTFSDSNIILYEKNNNNIFILDSISFNNFLSYNSAEDIMHEYTIISLRNNHTYGLDNQDTEYYRILIIELLIFFNNDNYSLSYNNIEFINNNADKYKKIKASFNSIIINNTTQRGGTDVYYDKYKDKYLKYKIKYLQLKNQSI